MKQKKISKEKYTALFCHDKRIRSREVIYVSPEVHRKLKIIASLFQSEYFTTLSSLADSILEHHIKTHRGLLNELRAEADEKFLNNSTSSMKENDYQEKKE